MTEVVLVKLGGSLITEKSGESCARLAVIERLAAEIATARTTMSQRLIVGHGSGSFGHVAAARYAIGSGPLAASDRLGISVTQDQAAQLHRILVGSLVKAGVETYSWAPSSAMTARAGRPASGALEPLLAALDLGLVPVTFGDVVTDRDWGASICSTEEVFRYLVGRLRRRGIEVRRMLWLGETDGVYDRDGRTIPRLDEGSYRQALEAVDAPAGTDVTGGMLLRLETTRALARVGIESWILNGTTPGLLTASLSGKDVLGKDVLGTCFAAHG